MANDTLSEPNLYIGLLAIRNEFINISELKHCLEVRRKIHTKSKQVLPLGEVLVQQRYLTPQDLEYLRMIEQAEPAVVVNTGSKQGITMPPGDTAYNVSKAGRAAGSQGLDAGTWPDGSGPRPVDGSLRAA